MIVIVGTLAGELGSRWLREFLLMASIFFFLKWRRQGAFLSKEGGDEVEALRV